MARRESSKNNAIKINDNLSGSTITLYYRMPTTSERQEYANRCVQRQGQKVVMRQAEARLESGLKILAGFAPDAFERLDGDKYRPIASDPGHPDFFPEWKPWVEDNAADLVILMAAQVFDVSCSIATEDIEGK